MPKDPQGKEQILNIMRGNEIKIPTILLFPDPAFSGRWGSGFKGEKLGPFVHRSSVTKL